MSFRCPYCRVDQPSGTTPNVHVEKTRQKPVGHGTQIVKEVGLCKPCYDKVAQPEPGTIADKVAQT